MATKKADKKAVRKAAETALKGFAKSAIRKAFDTMAAQADVADSSNDARQGAALDIVRAADHFRAANEGIDVATLVKGWRDNLALVTMELAVAGNRFAELKPGDKDKAATAKLTGYGNNVASIAKGLIELELTLPADCESYREVRKAVEAERAERRRQANPDAAKFADTLAEIDERFASLRKMIADTGDQELADALRNSVNHLFAQAETAIAKQAEIEAQAEAA